MADFPDERQSKRQRLDSHYHLSIEINRFEDLQNALVFRKTSSPEVKRGIQGFKDFVTSISKTENLAEQSAKVRLLKQYCDTQSPSEEDGVVFSDLISSWNHAGETGNDSVQSAVPAVLAQFLHFVSSYLEFREFGLSLCRSLLQKEQLRLFDRAFSSGKAKEHLISPCLRLLTEITTFDGGAVAAQLCARKDTVFKRLEAFLEQTATKEDVIDQRKPSLRRIAQRYVIANLKFQSTSIKGDLIGQGKILHALLKGIDKDGDDIIVDILQTLQGSVLNDVSLHKKSRLLGISNLQSLLALYDYTELPRVDNDGTEEHIEDDRRQKVRAQVNTFFLAAIQPGKGILLPETGWYPPGMDPDFFESNPSQGKTIDLGLKSPLHFDEFRDKIPVKNGTLSAFAQSLKPDIDQSQRDLLLKIFELAPELVADYFSKTKKFSSKPKDDPEWRAQSAFLFSVVQLPVPRYCGWRDELPQVPPPVSIVIESILPRVLSESDLTRCMNLAHDVLTLFAAKYTTVSIQKLADILRVLRSSSVNPTAWSEASERLIEKFIERSVPVKDVVNAVHRASKENKNLRAALLECLASFFQTLPQYALSENFDVATIILDTVKDLATIAAGDEDREILLDQLQNLGVIAERLLEVRWWLKPDDQTVSPFVALLQATLALDVTATKRQSLLRLLRKVLIEQRVIEADDKSFGAFIISLMSNKEISSQETLFLFIENCIIRVVRQPIRYLEQLEAVQTYNSDTTPLSLLACAVTEQWSFVAKGEDKEARKSIAAWIVRFYDALVIAGANLRVISHLQEAMLADSPEKASSVLRKAIERQQKKPITLINGIAEVDIQHHSEIQPGHDSKREEPLDLETTFSPPLPPPISLEGLTKWSPASLESDITSSRLSRLIRCTTSPLEEIRLQTFTILQSILASTRESSHPDSQCLHLLLGELLETIKLHSLSTPLPTIVSSISTLLLRILVSPEDRMYSKANRFLLRSPRWDVSKLPSYWITQILLREPEDDDGNTLETDRLLVMLADGLVTEQDMELYRRNSVFERVLALWSSPFVANGARRRICELLFRAWRVGDAARMTLVTRCGVAAWIEMALLGSRGEEERKILEALSREVAKVVDGVEGKRWVEGGKLRLKEENKGAR